MDFHPFIVHFPIALLVVYSILEFIMVGRKNSDFWNLFKDWILFFGLAGAFIALLTGSIAEEKLLVENNIVGAHELFAQLTTAIFSFLFVVRISLRAISKKPELLENGLGFMKQPLLLANNRFVLSGLALLGLISISFTGALGAALVYGPKGDLIISFVVGLLGL
jgi:hypothetical protein